MRHLIILFLALAIGCSENNHSTLPQRKIPTPPNISHDQFRRSYSDVYIRGYHDGYSKSWLGPISWVISGDYRAGWNAGQRDRNQGLPNMFD